MERTLSPDEKIRRAEEIYYRRKNPNQIIENNIESRKKNGPLKKMINQIIICTFIYTVFFIIQNNSYVFSEEVIKKVNEILEYDINITNIYNKFKENINLFVGTNLEEQENVEKNQNDENTYVNEMIKEEIEDNIVSNENIGGEVEVKETEVLELSQMEQDAKYIKENKSLIIPLQGIITSRYGIRESSNPIVPKNHTGIDIAENQGTIFVSAMDGIVEKVSGEGGLGNHIKITDGDVATVYAHCKTIYVKEGDTIKKGQQIGEVGSTGNSTGPHLHFEIKKEGRYVDPDLILEFK